MIPSATLIIGVLIVNAVVLQRTLLQDRYLSFSSAHWLVLVGVSLTVHTVAFYRGLWVTPFLLAGVLSLAEATRIRADAVDSRKVACEWIKDFVPAGELILVLEPKDVNLIKYYLSKRKLINALPGSGKSVCGPATSSMLHRSQKAMLWNTMN